jgi:hypothetical protein
MSGDPEQEYFADGIVEELTAAQCTRFFRYRPKFRLHLQGLGGIGSAIEPGASGAVFDRE